MDASSRKALPAFATRLGTAGAPKVTEQPAAKAAAERKVPARRLLPLAAVAFLLFLFRFALACLVFVAPSHPVPEQFSLLVLSGSFHLTH